MAYFKDLLSIISSQSPYDSPANVLAAIGSPSTSIAVLDHGTIMSHCISTLGDNEETVFQACSISKPITGVATMRLVQQGKLDLNDKIINLLPPNIMALLETPHTKHHLQKITVRHLMSHTSGLSVSGLPGYSQNPPNTTTILSGKATSNTPHVRIESLPGQVFSYSGGGITVLQVVLEMVTGQTFPELIRQLVFEPLGMTRSFYALPDDEANVATAYWTGYTPCEDKWRFQPEAAAAGLWTTPTDLLRVVRAVQKSLMGDDDRFMEKGIAEQMLTEVLESMALTWYAPQDLGAIFGHGGANFPSFRSILCGFADIESVLHTEDDKIKVRKEDIAGKIYYRKKMALMENCGICVMSNSALGRDVITKIVHGISFVRQWVQIPIGFVWYSDASIPFVAGGEDKIDKEWKHWAGTWGEEWVLQNDSDGHPTVRFGKDTMIRLLPAAIPHIEYEEGQSVDLIPQGLEIMLRLSWKQGKRVIELWQGATGNITVLERKSGDM